MNERERGREIVSSVLEWIHFHLFEKCKQKKAVSAVIDTVAADADADADAIVFYTFGVYNFGAIIFFFILNKHKRSMLLFYLPHSCIFTMIP